MTDNRQQATDDGQYAINDVSVAGSRWSVVSLMAHFFSVVFHPLFIPFYVIAFLMFYHPSYFSGISYTKTKLLFSTALNTIFFPLLAILIMKGLGFIKSVFLYTQQDRIGPYLSNMILLLDGEGVL